MSKKQSKTAKAPFLFFGFPQISKFMVRLNGWLFGKKAAPAVRGPWVRIDTVDQQELVEMTIQRMSSGDLVTSFVE